MGIKNIHPHVGIDYTAKKRVRSVVTENTAATMFAPFVSNRGPENVAYKVYSNAEFISTYGQLEFSEQGQVVLNIGNWLNAGGAVLAYRMTKMPYSFESNITNNCTLKYLQTEEDTYYHTINGLLTDLEVTDPAGTIGTLAVDNDNVIKVGDDKLYVDFQELVKTDIRLTNAWGTAAIEGEGAKINALARAKYSGTFYDGMFIKVKQTSKNVFKIEVYQEYNEGKGKNLIESFSGRTKDNYSLAISSSEYIGDLLISYDWLNSLDDFVRTNPKELAIQLADAVDTTIEYDKPTVPVTGTYYFVDAIADAINNGLKDQLSVKCDFILDAGYSEAVKNKIIDLLIKYDDDVRVRDDIIFIADRYKLYYKKNVIPEKVEAYTTTISDAAYETRLLSVYEQYLTTEDIYSKTAGREVYVTPTYFLAGLIPYNERTHGVFYPHAGKRRGVINDALSLSENPLPDTKDEWYAARYNYIEKDSTAIQFMSQSTFQQEDTALRFLNNSRSLNVISRNVERIGRTYLHEMNTVTSLNNLNAAITTYMNDWVQNRALSKCEVIVYADEYDDTLVHIILNIRFAGTIEIISVEINID